MRRNSRQEDRGAGSRKSNNNNNKRGKVNSQNHDKRKSQDDRGTDWYKIMKDYKSLYSKRKKKMELIVYLMSDRILGSFIVLCKVSERYIEKLSKQ